MIFPVLEVIFIALSILIFIKFIHHILKALFLIGALFSIMIIVMGFFVVMDLRDFKNNIGQQPSKMIYSSEGRILLAVRIDPKIMGTESNDADPITGLPAGFSVIPTQEFQAAYDSGNWNALQGTDYKTLIVDDSYFDTLQLDAVQISGTEITPETLRQILRGDDPIGLFIQAVLGQEDASGEIREKLLDQYPDAEEKTRILAFVLLLQQTAKPDNIPLLFSGVRKGLLIIMPETALVDALKFTPASIVNIAVSNIPKNIQPKGNMQEAGK